MDALVTEMGRQGIALHSECSPSGATQMSSGQLMLQTNKGDFGPFDQVLFATGRVPMIEGLNLAAAGVDLTPKGYIKVDDYQCTSSSGVYAIHTKASVL